MHHFTVNNIDHMGAFCIGCNLGGLCPCLKYVHRIQRDWVVNLYHRSIIQKCCVGLLYCGHSTTEQVNGQRDEQSKAQTKKTLLHVLLLLSPWTGVCEDMLRTEYLL
jgi:hypothetical protein